MNRHVLLLLIGCLGLIHSGNSQDLAYAKAVVDTLCSDKMAGRGYVRNGSTYASEFIQSHYFKAGLKPFGGSYVQEYGFPVIIFPSPLKFKVDKEPLEAGTDYIVGAGCPRLSGVFDIIYVDSALIDNTILYEKFEKSAFYKSIIVIDGLKEARVKHVDRSLKILKNGYKARALVYTKQKKLTWTVATEWDAFPTLYVLGDKIKSYNKRIEIDIQSELKQHMAENLIGYIKGTTYPDSFVVFSAHYDHLGMLGPDAYFRGANDNASGVAMMLDMARYYAKNPPPYSVAFIAFSGEEAGLFGSYYYTEHPLFPLKQISLLLNLDLMGTGDEGITMVNGEIFREDLLDFTLLNLEKNLLPEVKGRGKAANSDHHFFTERGVRAFFFYLMGKYNYYHDVGDSPEALTYAKYNEAFQLLIFFANSRMKK